MKKLFSTFAIILIATMTIFAGDLTFSSPDYPSLYGGKTDQGIDSDNLQQNIPIDKIIGLGYGKYKIIQPIPGNETQTRELIVEDDDESILEQKIRAVRYPQFTKRIYITIARTKIGNLESWYIAGSGNPIGLD